ncbi:LysR substrate-binding domain-containing protein [Roseibium salinum]|uniref:LysR substrate-binding domain-containing protein n=1 Tax=Roseibium salinum TaxID=1604349 RepID=A0ABT3QV68_9HYPH|nr:LysR substrate-binding domain-containing protein [Roseibium sp. DSM 29163]MCX2720826.1 LysR substrate-binding domain-containing protein [Roseibium sp. DSM 29163]MDN3722745.1 LysR substrate-binding domain-containing protein [Roseibium salinum]
MNADDIRKVLTVRHLRLIAALSELGLVSKVADKLSLTQPTVSKQISELERLIEAPIVTRRRNRLLLTAIGQRLADHARQVLGQIDRAAFDITAMASGVSGAVSIGAVSSVAPIILPDAIALLKRSAPEASVAVLDGHFVSLFPMLEAGSIDLLIARVWHPQNLPEIEQKVLLREPVVVVAGQDHPLTRKARLDWSVVVDWPWIMPPPNSVARRAVDALFAEQGLTLPVNMIASLSLSLNLEILRTMPALSLFPQSLARNHMLRGDLVVLPLDTRGFLSEARCFWRPERRATNSTFDLFLKCLDQTRVDG